MSPTPEQIARLPKWARDHLDRLDRRVRDAERVRDEAVLATHPDDSDAVLRPNSDYPVGLGRRPRVRFRLGEEERWEYVDVTVQTDVVTGRRYLELHGGSALALRPQVTNVLHVSTSRR